MRALSSVFGADVLKGSALVSKVSGLPPHT